MISSWDISCPFLMLKTASWIAWVAGISSDSASVQVLNRAAHIDLSPILPESRLYYGAYIFSPDEIRSAAYLISFLHGS